MKVEDLIKILSKFDGDTIVTVRQYDGCYDTVRPVVKVDIGDPSDISDIYREDIPSVYLEIHGMNY